MKDDMYKHGIVSETAVPNRLKKKRLAKNIREKKFLIGATCARRYFSFI